MEKVALTPDRYETLIGMLSDYPETLAASGVPDRFMAERGLSATYSFNYGRLDAHSGAIEGEPAYGYKAAFEVINRSDNHYLTTLTAVWSGTFGSGDDRHAEPRRPDEPVSFFLSPDGGRYAGQFHVGDKEPARLILYPVRIEAITPAYRDGLNQALSRENQDIDLIDRYLEDDRVAAWREELKQRRSELASEKKGFWLFRLFR